MALRDKRIPMSGLRVVAVILSLNTMFRCCLWRLWESPYRVYNQSGIESAMCVIFYNMYFSRLRELHASEGPKYNNCQVLHAPHVS